MRLGRMLGIDDERGIRDFPRLVPAAWGFDRDAAATGAEGVGMYSCGAAGMSVRCGQTR